MIKEIRLIYIGERFYQESKSFMSSIYTEDGKRYDWGFVQTALKQGYSITVRQATEAELRKAELQLNAIKKEKQL